MDVAISVEHLYKEFNGDEVLHDVNHEFEEGRIHGIVGNNGSGKTVLMKCMCGFLLPTRGRVLVDYQEVGRDMDFPDDMGVIIETPGFLPNASGFKNLLILANLKKRIDARKVAKTMVKVGLDPNSKKHVGKYSLGMRQRLGIAQAIMEDPSYLILDEPFNGLDKTGVKQMRELIKGLSLEGKTILLSSHNQADIDELADTVCEMDAGVLTAVR